MGREPRIQYEDAVYHIYPRGNRRERIAHSERDYRTLERYFIEGAIKMGVQPRVWYPMPNHFHAALETPRANLSAFMQAWLSRYARYYNRTYEKIGHLFQGRFGSRLVQSDVYMKQLIRYVALQRHHAKNPDKIDPFCDRYASHRFYMGETCSPIVRAWIEPMLHLFGDTIDQARKNYAEFLTDGLKTGKWQDFYKPKNDILGTDEFIKEIETQKEKSESVIFIPTWRRQQMMTELLSEATDVFKVQASELTSSSQRRSMCRIRQSIVFVGRGLGLRVNELAAGLGKGSSAVSEMLRTAAKHPLPEFEMLQARVKAISEQMSKTSTTLNL